MIYQLGALYYFANINKKTPNFIKFYYFELREFALFESFNLILPRLKRQRNFNSELHPLVFICNEF